MRRATALLLTATVVTGCFLLAERATVNVVDLESLFPAIEQLEVRVYSIHPDCEYLAYKRGAFSSNTADEFCRVFDFDGRHPGGDEALNPVDFDEQAQGDLGLLTQELDRINLRERASLNVVFDASGVVAEDSVFSFDGCVSYTYWPEWTVLPEDDPESLVTAINEDWYKFDQCPRPPF